MPAAGLHDYGKLVAIPVQRRLVSLLAGMHQGLRAGSSHEFLDMEEYKVGDDVSDIDWKTTARHSQPIIKRFESTAILTSYLLVDTGNTMAAEARLGNGETKRDVALEFATAICWLTALRGDHLGLVVGNEGELRSIPARSGISHAQKILRVAQMARVDGPGPALPRLAHRVRNGLSPRSILIFVTDHYQITPRAAEALKRLQAKHKVLVCLVEDRDPTGPAPSVGGTLTDVNAGNLPDFVAGDPTLRYQWSIAHRAALDAAEKRLRDAGITFASAGSRAEVLPALLELFGKGNGRG